MIVLGSRRCLALSFVALSFAGFADMISMNIRASVARVATPRALRGRVNAVEMGLHPRFNELGAFESGGVAALIGVVPAIVVGGGVTIGIAAIWRRVFPAMARIDRLEQLHPAGGT